MVRAGGFAAGRATGQLSILHGHLCGLPGAATLTGGHWAPLGLDGAPHGDAGVWQVLHGGEAGALTALK